MSTRIRLIPERIEEGLPAWLLAEIERFEPLDFPAGHGAINWLRDHIGNPEGPWEVVLTLDPQKRLLGFFALAYKKVRLHPDAGRETAMEVAWIARSAKTQKGFGRGLLTYAITIALGGGAVALVVSPHDKMTQKKVWIGGFCFSPITACQPEDDATVQVFLAIDDPLERPRLSAGRRVTDQDQQAPSVETAES